MAGRATPQPQAAVHRYELRCGNALAPAGKIRHHTHSSKHGRLGSCVETGPTVVLDVLTSGAQVAGPCSPLSAASMLDVRVSFLARDQYADGASAL